MAAGGRPVKRWALGSVALLAPLVAVSLSPAFADSALLYLGMLPTLVALPRGSRVAAAAAGSVAIVIFLGLLVSTVPWAAGILLAALGVGVAWSYPRGWHSAAMYITTVAALAAISAPTSTLLPEAPPSDPAAAAVVAGFALVGGLWVALVGRILLYDLPHHPPEALTRGELITFAAVLGLTLGLGGGMAVAFAPGSGAWSVLLTILLVVTPQRRGTRRRALWRASGTVLGGAVAAVLVVTLGHPVLLYPIGLAAAIASVIARLRAPYAVFSATLTMALVLLTNPLEQALQADATRILSTVVAAAAVVAISALVHEIYGRYEIRSRTGR